jgi:hypothetical protein
MQCFDNAKGYDEMLHELCEHQLVLVHRSTRRNAASQGRRTKIRSSNRDQENPLLMSFRSTTYRAQKTLGHYCVDMMKAQRSSCAHENLNPQFERRIVSVLVRQVRS